MQLSSVNIYYIAAYLQCIKRNTYWQNQRKLIGKHLTAHRIQQIVDCVNKEMGVFKNHQQADVNYQTQHNYELLSLFI